MSVDAVILAAGYSSRADGFKMEFKIDGKAVLAYVIEAFLSLCQNIIVVGGFQWERLCPLLKPYGDKVKLVVNENYEMGMFTSVKTGVSYVKSQKFFLTPGDYPLITTRTCEALLGEDRDYIIPSFHQRGGHPILLSSECIDGLLGEKEDSNLRDFLKNLPLTYLGLEEEGILYDVDTREDYEKIKQMMLLSKIQQEGSKMEGKNPSETIGSFIPDCGIINGNVYLDGTFSKVNLYIKDEKICSVSSERLQCKNEIDVENAMVLPGLIDPHVHFQLGVGARMSSDNFEEGSKKAALGGITTYIDFLDPIKDASQLDSAFEKRLELAKKSITDFAFHTTIANPMDEPKEIIEASKKFGITSIKLFTTYSDTDRRTKDNYIYELLAESKDTDVKIVVHAENDELIWNRKDILVKDHETSRPVISENIEVLKLAEMARRTGGNLYIVHVSAGSSVEKLIKEYHEELKNQKIILESCPHYFVFSSEVYEQEDGYRYTMTPPLRPEEERLVLNQRIDFITTIGTDHCPCEEKLKKHKYTSDIFMGVGGLEYSFLIMYGLFKDKIIDKYTKEPAKAYGLYPKKGNLFPGADADILVFQPGGTTKVDDKISIYEGRILQGKIDKVFLRGRQIVENGKLKPSVGQYIRR